MSNNRASLPARDLQESGAVREAIRRARRLGKPILVSLTRQVRVRDPLAVFAGQPGTDRHLWLRPGTGEALVGIGCAQELRLDGNARFGQANRLWETLLEDAIIEAPMDPAWSGPVLLGGFSFDPLRPSTALWDGFPAGRLVLPGSLRAQRDGTAWLTRNVVVSAEPLHQASRPRRSAECPGQQSMPMIAAESIGAPPAAWRALVAAMARGIRHGQLGVEKVVLARAERVSASVDPATALARLAHEYPSCTIFAIGHGDGVFLGATPERLVQLRGGVAATMALAGSVGRGADPAADADLAARLLASPKDRAEHAIVVRAQRSALTEVCTSVVADAEPHVRKLSNVQHLLTPIRGQLRPDRGIFDLLERLHPTPAVGGFPRQRALELIRQHEQLDRGWYAGPIGWVNRAGEGEFVVAIRSALLRGKSATLFAGCGIVGDSDLTGEYAESKWKLRPMLAALGV